jgi:hypothetical protein
LNAGSLLLLILADTGSNAGIAHRLWVTEGTAEKRVRKHGRFPSRAATTLNAALGFPPIVDDVTALRTSTTTDYIDDE